MSENFIPYTGYEPRTDEDMQQRADAFFKLMGKRRTIREFSGQTVSAKIIDQCIRTAGSAPSGANQQPWHFVVITDPKVKQEIRTAAEKEEREFYAGRAGDVWLDTLAPLGTDAEKPFLERAPVLIAIFEQKYRVESGGTRVKHYYSKESTGIATGLLITALHQAGLATLTHTPSPMNFLTQILDRPEGEKPFLLLVVGHPAAGVTVPDLSKKSLEEIRTNK
ncbi:MAG: nitroreductase family protein [Candidatus Marinimicrobia bacterium]|nr:nitroreductase family protein [Candidatus Neomarinimicrobiota bacterium]